jgi:D-alanyl-D-alanine carboxypeptidase
MFHRVLAIAVALGALSVAASARAQHVALADHPLVASNLRLLEAWLQAEMDYRGQPGYVIGIVYDQELIYAKGFGYADVATKRPMTTDTLFHIGSQSKTFTAVAVLQLHEQGKLSLDDPVEKYIPTFAVKKRSDGAAPITIFQLLTHTSGLLHDGPETSHWSDLNFPARTHYDQQFKSVDLAFAPGTKRKYSNLGIILAGQIVEVVSGKSFRDYVTENILVPLHMDSTYVELPVDQRARLATGYGRRMPDGNRETIQFWDAKGLAAAGGMFSNVTDLAKYVAWQTRLSEAGAREVLEPATLRNMQRAQWVDPDWKEGWGLGFHVAHRPHGDLVGHSGSVPGYFSTTYRDPQRKIAVIVLANSMDAQPYLGQPRSIPERVFDWVSPAVVRAANKEAIAPYPPEWQELEGTYRSIWGDACVLPLDGKLVFADPNDPDPKATAFTLESIKDRDHTFQIVEGPDRQFIGEEIEFDFGPDGQKAMSLIFSGARLSRVR